MRKYEFYQLDVFTDTRFAGNPLAVFPESEGLSSEEMQSIAMEMNLSETVFVLPSDKAVRRLRIFTPRQELPLAGHPVVGTWNLLAHLGIVDNPANGRIQIEQEVRLGVLPVEIEFADNVPMVVTMTQGEFDPGPIVDDEGVLNDLASSLSLELDELACTRALPVQVVSTGIRSLAVPVVSLTALGRIRVNTSALSDIYLEPGAVGCFAFTFETFEEGSAVHARFFAPADAILEDPATGSAAGSLSGYLINHGALDPGSFTIEQGDFMGRPSRIYATIDGGKGNVERVRIGGRSVIVAKGEIYLD
ncbi:MAG: PhzF family phenazine biosynthesis protein [Acidobacteria bacterium]|nr:MAG: PhzF family phenazine biosynthesis protein [Acidobacteriota bacterium]REK01800.1 MAG: PhzF family phenazine biosynthesis protein [Acidobacteriota bacterium]REK14756.1 MAG: PhzF family phenazine biosynthesis protein [Acidobacteriota bacterium]REK45471.1 MAG: PhzF family phenazine biosynthesis protein [Acidobacteriota bacterium]